MLYLMCKQYLEPTVRAAAHRGNLTECLDIVVVFVREHLKQRSADIEDKYWDNDGGTRVICELPVCQ